ncbi:MAG: hypothetical protein Q8R24_03680 [Legionellaceae bacterium]|nr:hypothetical protein [Legionellaceae bacterium]
MKVKSKKPIFSRNRDREDESNGLFNKIHKNLSFLTNTVFVVILAPTIVISSFLSHTSFLMFANIFLALGFVFHFLHRIYLNEVSYSELLISLVVLALLCLVAFYFSPVITNWTFINTLCFINLFSTSIISFFLIRNVIVPPLQAVVQHISKSLGYESTTSFYYVKPLILVRDRSIADRLLKKFYHYDSFSKSYTDDDLRPFNKIIEVLSKYVNKYQEPVLGYINNYDRIKELENGLSKLVMNGDTDSSLGFIKKKIDFKQTKMQAMLEVKDLLNQYKKREEKPDINNMNRFFYSLPDINEGNQDSTMDSCLELLEVELARQQVKIDELSGCIPRLI